MSHRLRSCLCTALCAGGLLLCLLPTIWSWTSDQQAAETITGYHEQSAALHTGDLERVFLQAYSWNAALAGEAAASSAFLDPNQLVPYEEQLQVFGDGIMGVLSIPKLDLKLPIFHGVEEEALSKGAGHLPSSSLPVGSTTGRSILSAHRGLLQAELFTRLDEMKKKDLFLIENPKETLAYEVFEIEVIWPEEVEALALRPQQDLVTLMTCTPYGVNNQRLLVTGRRVPYTPQTRQQALKSQTPASVSMREWIFRLWPWVLCTLCLGLTLLSWLRSHKKKKDQSPL